MTPMVYETGKAFNLIPFLLFFAFTSANGQIEVIKGSKSVDYSSPDWREQKIEQDREVATYQMIMRQRKLSEARAAALQKARDATEEKARQKPKNRSEMDDDEPKLSKRKDNSEKARSSNSHGAVNPVTGEFYAPAGGGNLVGTRDGTLYTPAGPNGYINSRTGQFVPAH